MAIDDEHKNYEVRDDANMGSVGMALAAIVLGLVLLLLFYPRPTTLDGAARAPVTTTAPTNKSPNAPTTNPPTSRQP